jgi:hypothetical protein
VVKYAWLVGVFAISGLVIGTAAAGTLPGSLVLPFAGADVTGHPSNETNGVPPGPPIWLGDEAPYGTPTWLNETEPYGPPTWVVPPEPEAP